MALFHFDNNREVRLDSPVKPSESNVDSSNTKIYYTVWDEEFENDLEFGDTVAITNNDKPIKQNVDKNGREYREHHTLFIQYSIEDFKNMSNEEKWKEIQDRYVEKEKSRLRENFPENRYDIEITTNGNRFEVYIYDKEYASLKKSNLQNVQQKVEDLLNGNFDVINKIENPVEFLEAYRKKSGGKTMYSAMISAYKDGKLSSGKIVGYLNTLKEKFLNFELDYDEYDPTSKLGSSASAFAGGYGPFSGRVERYFERERDLEAKYKSNVIDREQVKDLQKFIKENFDIELNEIAAAKMLEDCSSKYTISEEKVFSYEKIINNYMLNHFIFDNAIGVIRETNYKESKFYNIDADIDDDTVIKLQKAVKDMYNEDITSEEAKVMIKYDMSQSQGNYTKKILDIEKLKADCISGEDIAFGSECEDYLKNILTYASNGYNDSLESLQEVAQITETEYGRYNFDIHKSSIADLAKKSETMINDGEKELSVIKTDDKIVIKNKSTGKERIIDLNMLTSKLDDEHKQTLLNALNGFNKISLWEFAVEITKTVDNDVESWRMALAQYDIEKDKISIGDKVDSNTLLHEMIHAMMATVIDGKNTSNEPLFKEFVEAFEEEQRIHHDEKRLRNSILAFGNYTYCAENIFEFAAEAGCLWLSGKSDSEFTIATHFPKSYRLFVQLIEKIRAQETGRSTN